jgi:hypothetical protein
MARNDPAVEPVPNVPEYRSVNSIYQGTKSATPDLILFDDTTLPIEIMTDLLFQNIGGQEIINISRNDIINGQNVRYQLIANTALLSQEYNPKNIFIVPGTLSEYFDNFAIKLSEHIPESGTGPAPYYVGTENSNGCTGFPVLDKYDDTVIGCYASFKQAQDAIDKVLAPYRDIVYSDPENGNIVVDVTNMKVNENVEIQILSAGLLESDTIY